MKKKRNWLWLALMAALLVWTGYTVLKDQSPAQIWGAVKSADWRILLLGVPLMALFVGCEAKATHWVLRALGHPRPFRDCYFYSCAGFFFSNITPSASGGQPMQVYYMSRDGVPAAAGAMDMMLVTVGYQTATVAYGLLALAVNRQAAAPLGALLWLGFAIFLALDGVMLLLLFQPEPASRLCRWVICRLPEKKRGALEEKLEGQLAHYRQGAALLRRMPGLFGKVLLMSGGQLACSYAVPWLVCRAFGVTGGSFGALFAAQALCTVAVSYLPLPGSAGAAEGAFLRGFHTLFGAALVAPGMILSRAVSCYFPLLATALITGAGHLWGQRRGILQINVKKTCNRARDVL